MCSHNSRSFGIAGNCATSTAIGVLVTQCQPEILQSGVNAIHKVGELYAGDSPAWTANAVWQTERTYGELQKFCSKTQKRSSSRNAPQTLVNIFIKFWWSSKEEGNLRLEFTSYCFRFQNVCTFAIRSQIDIGVRPECDTAFCDTAFCSPKFELQNMHNTVAVEPRRSKWVKGLHRPVLYGNVMGKPLQPSNRKDHLLSCQLKPKLDHFLIEKLLINHENLINFSLHE